jgi:hypothetical protein
MVPRENNLNSLREVHERMRLYTVLRRDSPRMRWLLKQGKKAGKMPALPTPLDTIERLALHALGVAGAQAGVPVPQKLARYFTPLAGSHQPFSLRM